MPEGTGTEAVCTVGEKQFDPNKNPKGQKLFLKKFIINYFKMSFWGGSLVFYLCLCHFLKQSPKSVSLGEKGSMVFGPMTT